jgi:hypothetical protein
VAILLPSVISFEVEFVLAFAPLPIMILFEPLTRVPPAWKPIAVLLVQLPSAPYPTAALLIPPAT